MSSVNPNEERPLGLRPGINDSPGSPTFRDGPANLPQPGRARLLGIAVLLTLLVVVAFFVLG
ncbi:hypothetical protein [Actinotalea sp. K2]|uniref:hypothetical protein n=1 Tax=Actinotalea sp. K2 TaxID=2939438 RepID=UPI002016D22F|nr:hypothetical protein [Actinotalea sp. K2]MCL3861985.1 hypothetical protein [Actinotalea sp. K2]